MSVTKLILVTDIYINEQVMWHFTDTKQQPIMQKDRLIILILIITMGLVINQGNIFAQTINSNDIIGIWMGNVKMGDDYPRLVFEISLDKDRLLIGTVGSPEKGIKGIPLSAIKVKNDSVTFEIAAAMADDIGSLSFDKKSIEGVWKEGESKQILVLKSVSLEELKNSNPIKNFPYKLQHSNEYFAFYLEDKDIKVLNDLEKTLNKNFLELSNIMQTNFSDKIAVIIYPDIKEFHKAINFEDAPDWVVGAAGKNELKMVSPLNPGRVHDYESLIKSIVHELCHSVVINMREQGQVGLPKWLDEGFAFYYAEQLTEENKRDLLKGAKQSDIPSWKSLNNAGTAEFGDKNGYVFSALIVDFLINNYGYDTIRKLILQPNDFQTIFGLSELELERKWRIHLTK